MTYALIILLLMLMLACAALNLTTLPGNWIMAVLVVLWALFGPDSGQPLGVLFFVVFFGLLILGELVEFFSQIWGAKKYGASNTSTIASIIGAITGAILLVPFFFGIGAILGSLVGAWTGCFVSERFLSNRSTAEAVTAANSTLLGRFLGMVVKFGLGITMIVWTANTIWPA
jgi:uncharacterized protein YqgC (DUF456 family)